MDQQSTPSSSSSDESVVANADAPPRKRSGRHMVTYPSLKDLTDDQRRARLREARALNRHMCKDLRRELEDAELRYKGLQIQYRNFETKHYAEVANLRGLILELQSRVHPALHPHRDEYVIPPL
jgi:hypothetical protein